MNRTARLALFAVLVAALAAGAVLFAAGPEPEGAVPAAAPESHLEAEAPTPEEAIAAELRHRRAAAERALRDDDFSAEAAPPPVYERQIAEETPATLAVVRRFEDAFSRYELGGLGAAITRELRATTTAEFADQLLTAPPRVPAGLRQAPRARLGHLDFVPQATDQPTARLRRAELVGVLRRGNQRDPIAFELQRAPGGGWRVAGLGR